MVKKVGRRKKRDWSLIISVSSLVISIIALLISSGFSFAEFRTGNAVKDATLNQVSIDNQSLVFSKAETGLKFGEEYVSNQREIYLKFMNYQNQTNESIERCLNNNDFFMVNTRNNFMAQNYGLASDYSSKLVDCLPIEYYILVEQLRENRTSSAGYFLTGFVTGTGKILKEPISLILLIIIIIIIVLTIMLRFRRRISMSAIPSRKPLRPLS
ncbi:MAG: hypothetical protein WCK90_06535 [archaeon]